MISFRPIVMLSLLASCGPETKSSSTAGSTGTSPATETSTSVGADSTSGEGGATGRPTSDASSTATSAVDPSSTSSTLETVGTISVSGSEALDLPHDCIPWIADSCPSGMKCLPTYTPGSGIHSTHCSPVVRDPASLDQECKVLEQKIFGDDTCDEGLICWHLNEDSTGSCFAFCGQNYQCDDPFSTCRVDSSDIVRICEHCNPLLQDCIGDAYGCLPNDLQTGFWCQLVSDGGPTDTPCTAHEQCTEGHFCADEGQVSQCADSRCCAAFCDLSAPQCPNIGESCLPWFTPGSAPPPYDKVGRCGAK